MFLSEVLEVTEKILLVLYSVLEVIEKVLEVSEHSSNNN